MIAALRRDFRSAPVTFCLLAASVVLFLAVEFSSSKGSIDEARRDFGAVAGRQYEEEVHGPFDLWDGPWWRWLRIPISAFHHGNLLHLVFNVSSLWMLGPLMERRMSRGAYLGFWFFSATVSLLPEFYLGHYAVGLSGTWCAMFGWCLIERQYDPQIARRLSEQAVVSIWMFLFLFVGLTALGVVNIANVAHFTGVGYGWLNARAARNRVGRKAWVASHALLPLAIFGVLHPIWNPSYHAFLGRRLENLSAAVPHFREAVRRDPALPRVWLSLAAERGLTGDFLQSWRLAITGLQHNRSSEALSNFARDVWLLLPERDREAARKSLQDAFASDSDGWEERLRMSAASVVQQPGSVFDDWPAVGTNVFEPGPTDEDSSKSSGRRGRKRTVKPIDPDQTDSAAEGRTL